MSQIY
ncbi:hypothetical protein SCAR479_13860 [Seiridium cardinale]